jgi:hypothetical protein
MVAEFSLFGVRGISGFQRKSGHQKRSQQLMEKQHATISYYSGTPSYLGMHL